MLSALKTEHWHIDELPALKFAFLDEVCYLVYIRFEAEAVVLIKEVSRGSSLRQLGAVSAIGRRHAAGEVWKECVSKISHSQYLTFFVDFELRLQNSDMPSVREQQSSLRVGLLLPHLRVGQQQQLLFRLLENWDANLVLFSHPPPPQGLQNGAITSFKLTTNGKLNALD